MRRFQEASIDFRRFQEVSGRFRRFQEIPGDFRRFHEVSGGFRSFQTNVSDAIDVRQRSATVYEQKNAGTKGKHRISVEIG